jgi:hypothetical protein
MAQREVRQLPTDEPSIEELEHLYEIAHGALPIDVNQRNSALERFDSALKDVGVLSAYRRLVTTKKD